MLTVEDLFLLLTKANGEPAVPGMPRTTALNAALITDLQLAGWVQVTTDKRPRVQVLREGRTTSPVLDFGLQLLARRRGRRLDSLIWWRRLDPEQVVVDSLVRSRTLRMGEVRGRAKVLLPRLDPEPERQVRVRLAAVLTGRAEPTPADATILAILDSLGIVVQLLHRESGATSREDLNQRLSSVLDHSAASDYAVSRAVRNMRLATPTLAMSGATGGSV